MATSEERLKVLRLVNEGKLTAEEGAKLLEALMGEATSKPATHAVPPPSPPPPGLGQEARWFRVRVTDLNTGRVRVNIRLPITVVTAGVKIGARFSPEVEGLDTKTLMDSIRAGETGQIISVYDDKDGEHVEVFLE